MLGQTLGSYTIERELGRGGMGAVYTAVHTLLGRRAAVKVLLPEMSRNQELVQRFFNEARAATAIKHPSIVEIYDFGWAPDGSAYIVMEFMEGESLASRLRRLGRLPLPAALTVARQIANALAAAHKAAIVHRDLKPDNVYLVADIEVVGGERVKLLDFGIAKLAADGVVSRTTTGAIMGTPLYMSPEQCEGARQVDHRTDLYALGCILFEMLAGHPPFQSEGVGALIGAHLHVPPPTLRSVVPEAPAEVEAIVARLLAKAPAERFQSADELAAALGQVSAGSGALAAASPPVSTATGAGPGARPVPSTLSGSSGAIAQATPGPWSSSPAGSPPRRGRWLVLGGLVAAVGAAIAVVAIASSGGKASPEAGTAGLDAATVAVGDPDAATVAIVDLDATAAATPDAAPAPADVALAAMQGAVSARDWAALHAALDQVYDSTTDGDPRRAQADVLIEQTRPLILAVLTGDIEGDNYRGRCTDAKRKAGEAIKRWGDPMLPLKKLAARCTTGRGGGEGVPIDAGVAPPGDGLTPPEIRRVLQANLGRIRTCGGDAPLKLSVRLAIAPDGRVRAVRVDGASPDATSCVEGMVRAIRFPPSAVGAETNIPLVVPSLPRKPEPTTGPLEDPKY